MAKQQATAKQWQPSRTGLAIVAALSLLLAYGLGSLAIDTGSLLQYFLAFVLLYVAIRALIQVARGVRE